MLLVILVCGSYNRVWIFQHIYPNFYFICEGMKMIKNTKTITINTRITTIYVYIICLNIIMNVHTNMNINDGTKHGKGSKSDCVRHMGKLWTRLKDCVVRGRPHLGWVASISTNFQERRVKGYAPRTFHKTFCNAPHLKNLFQ